MTQPFVFLPSFLSCLMGELVSSLCQHHVLNSMLVAFLPMVDDVRKRRCEHQVLAFFIKMHLDTRLDRLLKIFLFLLCNILNSS